jgi:ABC-type cobalamin transport system permease subunit
MSTYKIGLVTHSLEKSQRATWVQMFSCTPPTRQLMSWVLSSVTGVLALQIPRPSRRVLILAQPPRLGAYLTGPFGIDDLEPVATNFS